MSHQEGHHSLIDTWTERHRRRLTAIAVRILLSRESAEDAVQEAFARAFRSMERFNGFDELPWLIQILINVCRNERKTRLRRIRQAPLDEVVLDVYLNTPSQPATQDIEAQERVHEILTIISPEDRNLIVQHYIEGLSLEEIGQLLQINPANVKTRLYRSRRRFEKAWKAHFRN